MGGGGGGAYRPGAQMVVHEKQPKKKRAGHDLFGETFSSQIPQTAEEADQMMAAAMRAAAERPMNLAEAAPQEEQYPHVYQTAKSNLTGLSYGAKFALPMGTTREDWPAHFEGERSCPLYFVLSSVCKTLLRPTDTIFSPSLSSSLSVTIPPSRPLPPKTGERLIPVSELDTLCKGSFPGYASLNRIQSIVFPTAYGTNENLLICGKPFPFPPLPSPETPRLLVFDRFL
jgi:antiviral helicase SLH1